MTNLKSAAAELGRKSWEARSGNKTEAEIQKMMSALGSKKKKKRIKVAVDN